MNATALLRAAHLGPTVAVPLVAGSLAASARPNVAAFVSVLLAVLTASGPTRGLLPGQAKRDLTTGQAKAMLASVRPRETAGKIRRRIAAEELAELTAVEAKIKKATAELKTIVLVRGSHLMDIHGVGPVVAARVLADVGDVTRFADRTGSRPGPAPHPWTRPPVSRTDTDCHGLGTGG